MEKCARNLCVYSIYMYVSAYIYMYIRTLMEMYSFGICNITEVILCGAEVLQIYES